MHWCFHKAISAVVNTFFLVVLQPNIQTCLQFVKCIINLFAKSYPIKFIQHGLMKLSTDAVALRTLSFGLAVIGVFQSQI